jgi:hypothetical protein
MAEDADDVVQLRRRLAALTDRVASLSHRTESGNPALAVRTRAKATYPTTAKVYYSCLPVVVAGIEAEGSAAALTVATEELMVLNVGTAIPAVGTDHLATFVENRWVMRCDA